MNKEDSSTGLEIAVIGMCGRFPGAKNVNDFWDNLADGRETIAFFSEQELAEAGVDPELLKNPDYVKAKGIIENVDCFEASFFNYSPGNAEIMDPQNRIFLESAWQALEDAGYPPGSYRGSIGVFAGASSNRYWEASVFLAGNIGDVENFAASKFVDKDYLSMQISYKLNLKGPSFSMYTACSSSLVAIHLACQAVLVGECDMALAGGITIAFPHKNGYIYYDGMILSPDGHCRAFAAKAAGTIGGSGVGIVVLKRLEDAVNNRDNIYAVIRGSAINNDGTRKLGFTAPSVEGQAEVIRVAQQIARVKPESIGYIEAHGTGTALGDPVEIEALKLAFKVNKRGFCGLGSVKTNVGHLDSAAGVAGFIKTVLALKHRLIPPCLHFEAPNPNIDFENSPFFVVRSLKPWDNNEYPLRAGVNSFGIGGTNAHIVLQEAPKRQEYYPSRKWKIFMLSAKTEAALARTTKDMIEFLKKSPDLDLADIAYTLQLGRREFQNRRMVVGSNTDKIIEALSSTSSTGLGNLWTTPPNEDDMPVIFMFSGQGSQYVNMGLELYQEESSFRQEIDKCIGILEPIIGCSIKNILYPMGDLKEAKEKIDSVVYSGPTKFVFEYALAKLLMKWGILPQAMIGHSFGEYLVACLSGVFSLEDALSLVVLRGRLMDGLPAGTMMGVPLAEKELKPLLGKEISLAAVNAPSLSIVSGPLEEMKVLEKKLNKRGVECLTINFPRASHSHMTESILAEFEEYIKQKTLSPPRIPYISNLTGTWITPDEATDPAYYSRHLRNTVRFFEGLGELLKMRKAIFVQVGPDKGLGLYVAQHPKKGNEHLILNLVKSKKEREPDIYYLLDKLGHLWLRGVKIDWSGFYANEKRCRVSLPTYPFEKHRFWIDKEVSGRKMESMPGKSLGSKKLDISDWLYIPSWKPTAWPGKGGEIKWNHACWVVFHSRCGLSAGLLDKLEKDGQKVVTVKAASRFEAVNDCEYTINPGEEHDYDRLFERVRQTGKMPDRILHLWGVTESKEESFTPEKVQEAQDMGFYSLLYIARAFGRLNINERIQIAVITNNMQDVHGEGRLSPEKITVMGPVRVIPLEYANMDTCSIDIVVPRPGSKQENELVDRLLSEFTVDFSSRAIAYRGNYRMLETFEPVRIEKPKKLTFLRDKGVYLVIGGLGGIGLVIAEYLARTVKAKLVLVGRTIFPAKDAWRNWLTEHKEGNNVSQKIKKILALEKLGAEVLIQSADVADREQMGYAVSLALSRFGKINGVIHSAMVVDGAIIQRRTKRMTEDVFAPKVKGTLVLDDILKDIDLDFFVLLSSNASLTGTFGEVGYCSANAFQDAFARYKAYRDDVYTVSINWGAWQEVGQAAKTVEQYSKQVAYLDSHAFTEYGILPGEGVEAFERVMETPFHQVAVSTVDLNVILEKTIRRKAEDSGLIKESGSEALPRVLHKRPELTSDYVAPVNDLEQRLIRIWQEYFGFEPVGVRDDFFEIGGDSLKAIIIASRIHEALQVNVPVSIFFTNPTVEGIAEFIEKSKRSKYLPVQPAEKKTHYELSPGQRRLYFMQQLEPARIFYNMPHAILIEGELDRGRLDESIKRLIKRHESLRTLFELIADRPVQRILDEVEFGIENFDLNSHDKELQARGLKYEDAVINNFLRAFDLSKAPLLRAGLIRLAEKKHILIVDMHHIISDGNSLHIFENEFFAFYRGDVSPSLKIQYKDFSEWQNRENKRVELKEQEEFWLKEFAGDIPILNIPTDFPRPQVKTFEGDNTTAEIDQAFTEKIKGFAFSSETTLYTLFLAVYKVLLLKYSAQDVIVVGSTITGRKQEDLQNIIGMFINMLAIKSSPGRHETFRSFLEEVKQKVYQAFDNQDFQFEELVVKLGLQGKVNRNPLFDVVFSYQRSTGIEEEMKNPRQHGNLEITSYKFEYKVSPFDLILGVFETGRTLTIHLAYSTILFKKTTAEKFISRYIEILTQMVENIDIKLDDITLSHDLIAADSDEYDEHVDFDF